MTPKLVIFDVDGTLIDSQAHILAAMTAAFDAEGLAPPSRGSTLAIVGLSLPVAMARLAPAHEDRWDRLVAAYKDSFANLRQRADGVALSPLYPGARAALDALSARDDTLLAIATGKSRRGMEHVFDLHGVRSLFHSVQVADDHPSKPHPSMVEACLRETGVDEADAMLLGDTTYDMEMGRLGGVRPIGVSWGYHRPPALTEAGAETVLDRFDALPPLVARIFDAS